MDPNAKAASALPVDITVPLFVDLDGSLIQSDTLWDGVWSALRNRPIGFLQACLHLGSGRAQFKRRVASLASPDPAQLPYREELVAFLSGEASAGRPLILATAADELVAQGVARHLGLFQQVIASDGVTNRKGARKLEAIRAMAPRFLYVGDSAADLKIWEASQGAIVAGDHRGVLRGLRAGGVAVHRQFPSRVSFGAAVWRAIRAHQWPKNLLVFLPVFLGHRTAEVPVWAADAVMLAVLCLTASSAYVLNDLLDLEADRAHAHKRTRPFAAGDLSIPAGLLLFGGLAVASVASALFLPAGAQLWVAAYFAGSLFYSLYLKTCLLVDVVGLAMLYVLRVMAGGAATGIAISPWTLAFCLFIFYSLALAKRFSELRALAESQSAPARRSYQKGDLPVVAAIGVASGTLAVVVFALYISSPEVGVKYRSPEWLWLACPVLLYWFGRLWLLANRGEILEDPVLFTLKDKTSYLAAACIAVIWLLATLR